MICSAYLIAAIGIATNPWQITVSAKTFLAALNGSVGIASRPYHLLTSTSFGIFYGPCSGVLVTDFWIVRKKLIKSMPVL